jgi:tetratricopeptide (TPR) repeat protein
VPALPNLEALSMMDERLRQVPRDNAAFGQVLQAGQAELDAARASGDPVRLRKALTWIGTARRIARQYDRAERDLGEALELAQASGDPAQAVGEMIRLAELERCRDDFTRSETMLRVALAVIRKGGDARLEDFALQHLGKTLIDADRAGEAIVVLERALNLRQAKGDQSLIASTEEALARARRVAPDDPGEIPPPDR